MSYSRHAIQINDAYICDDGSFHFNILLPSFGGDNVLSASPPPSTIDGDVELVLGEAAQGYGADDAPASFGEVALEPVNGDDVHDGDEQVPWNDHNDEDEAAPPPDDYVNNAETGDQATAHDDDDDVDFGASFVPLELDADINAPRVLRPATTHTDDNVAQPRVPKATKPEVDFWEALDPHVVPATGATVRPFRKGAVSKTYRVVEQSVKRSAAGKALDTTVREFLLKMGMMSGGSVGVAVSYHVELLLTARLHGEASRSLTKGSTPSTNLSRI